MNEADIYQSFYSYDNGLTCSRKTYIIYIIFFPKLLCHRPQRSWGKVIFSQASVILSTGGGGVPGQVHPPGPGTPPGTRYTPRTRYTPLGPGTPPRTRYPPGPGTPLGPGTPPRTRYTTPGAVHAGRYGQQVGGMHPTGMHSCYKCVYNNQLLHLNKCPQSLHI